MVVMIVSGEDCVVDDEGKGSLRTATSLLLYMKSSSLN
jgi:hypothetical protein